jgi:hypothetical protein
MMSDYAMCTHDGCPDYKQCMRNEDSRLFADKSPRQTTVRPHEVGKELCDLWWPITDKAK